MPLLRSRQPRSEHKSGISLPSKDDHADDDEEANKGKNTKSFFRRNKLQTIILLVPFLLCIFLAIQTNNNLDNHTNNNNASSSPTSPRATNVSNMTESEISKPKSRRQQILDDCGLLCDLSRPTHIPHPYFGYFAEITAPVDCQRLFESEWVDKGQDDDGAAPPNIIPEDFHPDYAMNGRARVPSWYIDREYKIKQRMKKRMKNISPANINKSEEWESDMLNELVERVRRGDFGYGNYQTIDRSTLYHVLSKVAQVKGQSVLVVGSETPWVEALCLAAGAANVTTLEYAPIHSHHPRIVTYTPSQFRQAYLNNDLPRYDAVVSYSSMEHSGLGRYGDALNPFGDLMALARVWCVTKPRGSLTLGLSSSGDEDTVYFNAGRIYGPQRWPYMATNWARVNYSADWPASIWQDAPDLPRHLKGPDGHKIFWNQSSLVFRKTGPPGSLEELRSRDRCPLLNC